MSHASSYLSWLALLVALVLWGCFAAFAWEIVEEESARDSNLAQTQQEGVEQATLLRVRALARETERERALLDEIADRDIVEVLSIVEGVSRDAGIPVKIGESLSANASDSSAELRNASLVVEAQGSFPQVIRAIGLLETLPLPSSIVELHLEELPAGANTKTKTPQWRAVVRLTILTSANL